MSMNLTVSLDDLLSDPGTPIRTQRFIEYSIRVGFEDRFEDAVSKARIGDKIVLGFDDQAEAPRVAVFNAQHEILGWFPPHEKVAGDLIDGRQYRAHLTQIIPGRYGGKFAAIVFQLGVAA